MLRRNLSLPMYGISLSILLAAFLFTTNLVKAQPRVAGVQAGDWADYDVTFQGNSTNMMAEDLANVTEMRLTVIHVSGTNVTVEAHTYYENGSDTIETGWIDVDTGADGGDFTAEGILIAANLNQGEPVYTNSTTTIFGDGTINETITRDYLGGFVWVNHFMMNMSIDPNPFFNMTLYMSWYWYRDTGIPAEMTFYYEQEVSGFFPESFSALESSSNMTWFRIDINIVDIIPEFPASAMLPLLIFATFAIIVLTKIHAKCRKFALPSR